MQIIIADSLEECFRRLLILKEAMEKNRLRVNAGKTKVMISDMGLQSSGEYPYTVWRTRVGNNSIYCSALAANSGYIRNAAGNNDWHQILTIKGVQGNTA